MLCLLKLLFMFLDMNAAISETKFNRILLSINSLNAKICLTWTQMKYMAKSFMIYTPMYITMISE